MKSLKLLIIGPKPPPVSGVSIANEHLYLELLKQKKQVQFINTEVSKSISTNTLGKFSFKKSFSSLIIYLQFYKVINSNIVYITIGQSFFGVLKYLPFLVFAKALKRKTIVHLHGGYLKESYFIQNALKKMLTKSTIKLADYGIVLSKSLISNFTPFLKKEKIFVVENFFEDILMTNETELFPKKFEQLKVVFLSNLIEEKGINLLVQAIKNLNEKGLNIELNIAGNMTNDFDSNSIKNIRYIQYSGVVSGKSKKELLINSNVFCLPTYYKMEGQPISIIEAMATGNVILTTKHAGIPDICNEKNGFFCFKNDLMSLQEQLEIIYFSRKELNEMSLYNYKYAKENFRLENFINKLNFIFNKCLN